jgi:paired amphipathic helix protein Sin3a
MAVPNADGITSLNTTPTISQTSQSQFAIATPPAVVEEEDDLSDMGLAENLSAPRSLTVADALSYIDHVKRTFHDRPHVYTQFLDIMREFKEQTYNSQINEPQQ